MGLVSADEKTLNLRKREKEKGDRHLFNVKVASRHKLLYEQPKLGTTCDANALISQNLNLVFC